MNRAETRNPKTLESLEQRVKQLELLTTNLAAVLVGQKIIGITVKDNQIKFVRIEDNMKGVE